MKRALIIAAVAAVVAASLTGCGKAPDPDPTGTPNATQGAGPLFDRGNAKHLYPDSLTIYDIREPSAELMLLCVDGIAFIGTWNQNVEWKPFPQWDSRCVVAPSPSPKPR